MEHADPLAILTTARLRLRRFTAGDLDLLDRLNSDLRVMRYAGGVKSRAQTEVMLHERILAYYDEHPGLGIYATLEREGGACVGLHLLNHIQGEPDIQLGYLLFPEHWGRGYATEMAEAVLRCGFAVLRLPRIVAITNQENTPSQQVLLKAGLHRHGDRHLAHPAYASSNPLAWFERDREAWLAERGAPR